MVACQENYLHEKAEAVEKQQKELLVLETCSESV